MTPAGLPDRIADHLALFDRQREGLLAVDVLAGLQSIDGDLRVPVVGSADGDHIDVLAVERAPMVAGRLGPPLAEPPARARRALVIDVGDGDDVRVAASLVRDGHPAVSQGSRSGAHEIF